MTQFIKSPIDKAQIELCIRMFPAEEAARRIADWAAGMQDIAKQQFDNAIQLTKMEQTFTISKN
jgi:hypothetical protein